MLILKKTFKRYRILLLKTKVSTYFTLSYLLPSPALTYPGQSTLHLCQRYNVTVHFLCNIGLNVME